MVKVGVDSAGKPVYETRWVQSPTVEGKRVPLKTIDQLTEEIVWAVYESAEPMVYDIYDYHDSVYLDRQAKLRPGEFSKDEWVNRLLENKTRAFEREGALYEQYRGDQLKSILTKDSYDAIRGRIMESIRKNENPDEAIRRMRDDIFGLEKGERNKGITYKAE